MQTSDLHLAVGNGTTPMVVEIPVAKYALTIHTPKGEIKIDYSGNVEITGMELNEASKEFWRVLGEAFPTAWRRT